MSDKRYRVVAWADAKSAANAEIYHGEYSDDPWYLIDTQSNEIIYRDGGEPEDMILVRDLSLFVGQMNSLSAELAAALAEKDRALAQLVGAVEALRPFSDCADRIDRIDRQSNSVTPDDASYRYSPSKGPGPTVGEIRQARAALADLPAEAERIRRIVFAAEQHYEDWGAECPLVPDDEGCAVCRAVRPMGTAVSGEGVSNG